MKILRKKKYGSQGVHLKISMNTHNLSFMCSNEKPFSVISVFFNAVINSLGTTPSTQNSKHVTQAKLKGKSLA